MAITWRRIVASVFCASVCFCRVRKMLPVQHEGQEWVLKCVHMFLWRKWKEGSLHLSSYLNVLPSIDHLLPSPAEV